MRCSKLPAKLQTIARDTGVSFAAVDGRISVPTLLLRCGGPDDLRELNGDDRRRCSALSDATDPTIATRRRVRHLIATRRRAAIAAAVERSTR
jgi:hypothetical protein